MPTPEESHTLLSLKLGSCPFLPVFSTGGARALQRVTVQVEQTATFIYAAILSILKFQKLKSELSIVGSAIASTSWCRQVVDLEGSVSGTATGVSLAQTSNLMDVSSLQEPHLSGRTNLCGLS